MQVCVCVTHKTISPRQYHSTERPWCVARHEEVHASVQVMVPFKFAIKLSSIPCICQHHAYYTLENNSLASSLYVETKC
jgi:hypothetical protein